MAAVKVFISYSHEGELWKNRLLGHLRVLERQGTADIWGASHVEAGTNWPRRSKRLFVNQT
jgi:hypothetical protein